MCDGEEREIVEQLFKHYQSLLFKHVVVDGEFSGCLAEIKVAGCRLIYLKLELRDGSVVYLYEPPSVVVVKGSCIDEGVA